MDGTEPSPKRAPLTPADLRDLDALRGVTPETLQGLLGRSAQRVLERGECLVRKGEDNCNAYIVLSGLLQVQIGEGEHTVAVDIGVGETVGELSLLAQRSVSATVTAAQRTHLLTLDESSFFWLIHVSHGFAVSLLTRMAERLRTNNETVQATIAMRRELEHAALHDALTGVHSRRWLDQALPRVVQRHQFAGDPFALAVVDVDHFKRVNDTFGHPAGDSVLAAVAATLRDKLRPTDLIARFGGEEFVLLLPQTPTWGALRAAERVREAVAKMTFRHDDKALPQVTISIGIAALKPGSDARRLLSEADQALYLAKHSGRNQTLCFSAPPS
jgi:diguanylate cyclase (GGDEF)-like protein